MYQQCRGAICQSRPLEECATQIQALVRGFLCRKDNFFIDIRPNVQRYSSYVSALTVEGFSISNLSYQDDLMDEHPGFEGSNHEEDFCSPIRKPRRIASKESTGSSLLLSNHGMRTVAEDDEHPGFESPGLDEAPVKRPTRLLSKESVDSTKSFIDESDLLFSPNTVNAACAPRRNKKMSKLMKIQEMPFARGQKALARKDRPARVDRPASLPVRHRSDASMDL